MSSPIQEDYYAYLGLKPEASFEEISKQYQKLKGSGGDSDRVKTLNHVFGILSNYRKRYDYDAKHHPKKIMGQKGLFYLI